MYYTQSSSSSSRSSRSNNSTAKATHIHSLSFSVFPSVSIYFPLRFMHKHNNRLHRIRSFHKECATDSFINSHSKRTNLIFDLYSSTHTHWRMYNWMKKKKKKKKKDEYTITVDIIRTHNCNHSKRRRIFKKSKQSGKINHDKNSNNNSKNRSWRRRRSE